MVNIITGYKCPHCKMLHKDEQDARDCCIDVFGLDRATMCECEMCGKYFNYEEDAESCEEQHTIKKDKHFRRWEEKENIIKLTFASNHPQQKKLIKVKS